MPDASSTIDPKEATHFGGMAADWWDPRGSSAMLHRINPLRIAYLRERIDRHWGSDPHDFAPLAGRSALDVGCGAGLLSEPLARLGAQVTGIDAAPENIAVAEAHAGGAGLLIDYRACGVESITDERFDLVTAFEVIEHVSDQSGFVRGLARVLAPGGLLILSTPNRTMLSRTLLVAGAEATGQIPRGTHDWHRFINPAELSSMIEDAALVVDDVRGLAYRPTRGFSLSKSTALDYFLTATHS